MDSRNDEMDVGALYDWWSRHPRLLKVLYYIAFLGRESEFRQRAIEMLNLEPGETVFELGCGNGNSFPAIHGGIGRSGTLVGLDASRGMVQSARSRIRARNWENVNVVRGDVRRLPHLDGTFDAAYAAMSLSAVQEPKRAIEATMSALRPEGRLVVLDAQPFNRWPCRFLNPVLVRVATRATNWEPQVDLVDALRRAFETVEVATFNGGSIFIAYAQTKDVDEISNRSSSNGRG